MNYQVIFFFKCVFRPLLFFILPLVSVSHQALRFSLQRSSHRGCVGACGNPLSYRAYVHVHTHADSANLMTISFTLLIIKYHTYNNMQSVTTETRCGTQLAQTHLLNHEIRFSLLLKQALIVLLRIVAFFFVFFSVLNFSIVLKIKFFFSVFLYVCICPRISEKKNEKKK